MKIYRVKDLLEEDKKIFVGKDVFMPYAVEAHKNCCLFCKHNTDIIYDWTNGPYAFACDLDCYECEKSMFGKCKKFESDGEDYEEKFNQELESQKSMERWKNKENFIKMFDEIYKQMETHNNDELEIPKISCEDLENYRKETK